MEFQGLGIDGAWIARSKMYPDNRGTFREWFRADECRDKTGFDFSVAQANISVSGVGVLRGIHYSLAEAGQAKWVTCAAGSVLDVIVDLRPNSATFREFVSIELSGQRAESVIIDSGIGHAFLAMEEHSIVTYLLTSEYNADLEYGINPFDPDLSIPWPRSEHILSSQDEQAPSLVDRLVQGLLPK